MSKHKSPTKTELAQWEEYGSYAGDDAVHRMIVEIHKMQTKVQKLRDVNTGLVETVVDLRETLEEYGQHPRGCSSHNPSDGKFKGIVRDKCDCGLEAKLDE